MRKELISTFCDYSFYSFTPDILHLYDKEEPGRIEPVHRYTVSHILHQLLYLMMGGYSIFYMEKQGTVVSYVVYTKCSKFVFDSGDKNDYYVIFYYTYPEYRGNGYASIMMHALFDSIQDSNDFYERIALTNTASIAAAKKIGFVEDGYVKKSGSLHKLIRTTEQTDGKLFKYDRSPKKDTSCVFYT